MINISDKVSYYIDLGLSRANANSRVSQDIILSQIANSKYKNNITVKGGIVLFNITGDLRRTTEDIDIDFIKYSLEDDSIRSFLDRLCSKRLGITISLIGAPTLLHHQNYQGKRVNILIEDTFNNILKVKMDIGVQSSTDIEQDEYLFNFESLNNKLILQINTKEQIFVEKLLSLVSHGIRSTRYKDICDMYYFITLIENQMDRNKVIYLINEYIINKVNEIKTVYDLISTLRLILSNNSFTRMLNNSKYNWLEADSSEVVNRILGYVESLETVEV